MYYPVIGIEHRMLQVAATNPIPRLAGNADLLGGIV